MFNRFKPSDAMSVQTAMAALFLAVAALLLSPMARAADDYLEPEAAFKFSARMADARTVEITYVIADGYYMYREPFSFKAEGAKLGQPVIPPGKVKFDDTFQMNVETYRKTITIRLPVEADGAFTLSATGQGCADKGLCYAPMESQAKLSPNGSRGLLAAIAATQGALNEKAAVNAPQNVPQNAPQSYASSANDDRVPAAGADSEMGRIEASLKS